MGGCLVAWVFPSFHVLGGTMGGFLVAWVFPSFHFYLFLKTLLRIMCSFRVSAREKDKKKLKKDEKLLEISITISVGCFNIPTKLLAIVEKFIEDRCVSGLCALERGRSFSRIHLQMVCKTGSQVWILFL